MSIDTATRKIDCHVHVFHPARFPYAADARYRPVASETAPVAALDQVLDAHGVQHALIVGPNSGYGLDNRCLFDALAHGKGRNKGIAVVANDASRGELQELRAAGVVGVAFNVALLGVDFYCDAEALLERLCDLDLWAQVQVQGEQLVVLRPMLQGSGAKLLFDHCGRPDPNAGVGQVGFAELLALAETGGTCVKLSSLVECSALAHPHPDGWPFVQALFEAYTPERLVWASDWPFLRAPARIDYGPVMAVFEQLLPDQTVREAVFWETPRSLFGWEVISPHRR